MKGPFVVAHLGRGIAYHAVGAYERAIDDLSIVLRLRRTNAQGYFYRALAYQAIGAVERAKADIDSAERRSPFNPTIRALVDAIGSRR